MNSLRVLPDPFPPLCASAWGDDRYGLWCEIEVGGVVQRLRWIEPGTFWMGSQRDEANFFDDERPCHRVTLTRGFWLADTACTQALWQAVVGDTPSYFIGDPELPVEKVSWDAVTDEFLVRMNRLTGDTQAFLPSEAQWEYACRAGTETAYHFGEGIDTDQVNYDDNSPPLGGREGEYRMRTVPVKALPANSWGLYQMHGNVREWCADAMRRYTPGPVEDPDGGQESVRRVLRGGAWHDGARGARSAFRFRSVRAIRDPAIGFRFALRSIEPSAGGGMGGLDEARGAR